MTGERFFTALEGAALAFLVAFGGSACLITGFGLAVPLWQAAAVCAVCALFAAVCFTLRLWICFSCVFTFTVGYLWGTGLGTNGLAALLCHISEFYDRAYRWGALYWGAPFSETLALTLGVGILGGLAALTVAAVVCCRGSAFFAMLAGLTLLAPCLVVTDTVPDNGSLYILLLGLLLVLLTQTVRRRSAGDGARLTYLLALPAALALFLLFLAVPREGYTFTGQAQVDAAVSAVRRWYAAYAEQSPSVPVLPGPVPEEERLDLDRVGPQWNLRVRVMEVTATETGPLYLRGQSYDVYEGTGWSQSGTAEQTGLWPDRPVYHGRVSVKTVGVQPVLYIPYYPWEEWPTRLENGALPNSDEETEYAYSVGSPDQGGRTRKPSAGDAAPYLTLPKETERWAAEMLEGIGAGMERSWDGKAEKIGNYVRNTAEYSLSTGRMPGDETDFARWFLEDSDTGYCVHFATAAAVLLRAAGVPARYVTGYLVEAEANQAVPVVAGNAHAWVEYWSEAAGGWAILEATPAAGADVPETDGATSPPPVPAESEARTEPPVQTAPQRPTAAFVDPGSPDVEPSPPDSAPAIPAGVLRGMLWLALLAALTVGQWQLRLRLRHWQLDRGTPNERALARWREITLLEGRLKLPPEDALTALAQKAKFSQHTITDEELSQLDSRRRDLLRRLRKRDPLRRLIDRLVFAAY